MLGIDVRGDFLAARRMLGALSAEVPRAVARALNDTGFTVRKDIQAEMRRVFKGPTPWALNAYIVVKATPSKLTTMVSAQEKAEKSVAALAFLGPNIKGGPRSPKRFEILLRKAGYLAADEFLVPSRFMKLDDFGNVPRSEIQKILSNLRAHFDPRQNTPLGGARRGRKKTEYFWHRRGGGFGSRRGMQMTAIWRRTSAGNAVPAFIVTRAPFYTPRFDPEWVAGLTIKAVWPRELSRQLGTAINRAR